MSMWTLEQSIEFVRQAETVAAKQGFHLAISGSVLYRGQSDKDLDVIVYPHKTSQVSNTAQECFMMSMNAIGVLNFKKAEHSACGDDKAVYWSEYNGKRIDWFFLK